MCGHAVSASDKPVVRVSVNSDAALSVEATDPVGLDSLAISWVEGDVTYETQLSRAEVDRSFKRTFPLREVFPSAASIKGELRITVTVRNTRGATASTTVTVRAHAPHER
jgi:hypothetical protein